MKMKLMRKITHDPHGNEHKLYPLKPNIGENPSRRWGIFFDLFFPVMEMKIQRKR
jgi:hypothetical protein